MAVGIVTVLCSPIYWHRKKLSEAAEKKWQVEDEEADTTIYVRYGNYDIPILKSQQKLWDKMHDKEKWGLFQHLQHEVKGGRLTVEKSNGITKFLGITEKGKTIKHNQKQRTKEEWKTSHD